ncbi:uncharacterized protein LOC116338145 [Contarinia nasturtii]|uniref:uncharacterized protein LOC116338145 n=1 Tax=Contarinia nasturtii TaxID=265458 RepID=UPI0012D3940E|nr:uncharacterized protein LOC116338145 [Contarinia nasturtii]
MDLLKKMFGLNGTAEKESAVNEKNVKSKVPAFGNDFKKPIWYDEESDDELFDNKMFGFQVFSDPIEIQKYHEQQMRRMLKAFEQFDDTKGMNENFREEYMKPGFENFKNFVGVKPSIDVDLDGEIYADQLHTLLQRISPELEQMRAATMAKTMAPTVAEPKRKLTDEEKVMDQIHCIDEDEKRVAKQPELGPNPSNVRIPHYGGAFEGIRDGPKVHRQSFSYQYSRKPDGVYSSETVVDPNGNTKTVIKRTIGGKTNTQTLINGIDVNDNSNVGNNGALGITDAITEVKKKDWIIDPGRHFYINKDGYALPKNLW